MTYNSTRIALSERARELATLRVLGFTRGEISYILLAEVALLVVAALPLGCLAGLGLTELIAWLLDTELFRIPVVIRPATYGYAVLLTLGGRGGLRGSRAPADRPARFDPRPEDPGVGMHANLRRFVFWGALAALIALGLALAFRPQAVPVDTRGVARGTLVVTVEDEGRTRVHDIYTLSAPVTGRMRRVDVHVGDAVDADKPCSPRSSRSTRPFSIHAAKRRRVPTCARPSRHGS